MSPARRSVRMLAAVVLAALTLLASGVQANAEDDPAEGGFADEVETVAPIRLPSKEGPQLVEVFVHLWGSPRAAGDDEQATLDVVAESPPPFVRGLRVLQADQSAGAETLRFTPGSTVTFGPGETARPVRLAFDLVKAGEDAADERGLDSGELVLVITSADPEVVPQIRRLVLPFEYRPGADLPETTGARVQMRTQKSEKVKGGTGIMRFASKVTFSWEDPTPENSHCYSRCDPYVRLMWAEAVPDVFVLARGQVSGGIPPVDIEIEARPSGAHPFNARLRDGHAFNVLIPLDDVRSAGTIRVTGRLLAFKHSLAPGEDKARTDESHAVAVLPFDATFTRPVPLITSESKLRVNRARGDLSGWITLKRVQPGTRHARVQLAGATHYGLLRGNGASTSVKVNIHGVTSTPASATITFSNFGEITTVTVPVECDVSGVPSERDPTELAKLEGKLSKYGADPAQLQAAAAVRKRIVGHHEGHRYFEPGLWVRACNDYFDELGRLAAAMGDPNWVGWSRRRIEADEVQQRRRSVVYERMVARLYRVRDACSLGQIDVANRWTEASAGDLEEATAADPDLHKSALGSLAAAHRYLAEATYHRTGEVDAARALWKTHNDLRRRSARNPATFRPSAFPFDEDAEYRK